jgi:endonuclease-8
VPEGDTIFRSARTLHRALGGSTVTGFETQLAALARVDADQPIVGRTVEYARATGKWLQIGFSGDLVLLTHMLMSGSWHIYRPGEAWQKSRYHMRVVVATPAIIAVAFNVQVAEFHTSRSLARRQGFNQLGPDVLGADFDEAAAVASLASNPDLELGVALLSQSILAGLGNVFKSEVCFVAGVNPFERVGELSKMQLNSLVSTARKLMAANVANAGMRQTTGSPDPEERLWVYQRTGQPCRQCGAAILSRKQGIDARTSFWCPGCQSV